MDNSRKRKLTDLRAPDKAKELSAYRDQRFQGSLRQQESLLKSSTTLYVGNLSYYTREEQIYELFNRAGDVRRVVMGLDRFKKAPCGFCFVEYYSREDSEVAVRCINGTRLDDRIIRTDWDAGFIEGRQFGRGRHGGQIPRRCMGRSLEELKKLFCLIAVICLIIFFVILC